MVNAATEDTFLWVFSALFIFISWLGHRFIMVRLAVCRLWMQRLPKVEIADGDYLEREALTGVFKAALRSARHETLMVYGPRGSGKTSFIRSFLGNRRGVISIQISKKSGDEASSELIEAVSTNMDLFGSPQNRRFVEDVFSSCMVSLSPVVVVSVEEKASGEVLEAVLIMCKILAYDKPHKRAPRMVVDISSSRTTNDATMKLEDLRVIGVHVGHFPEKEAQCDEENAPLFEGCKSNCPNCPQSCFSF
jgi:hypothetical protein